MDSSKNTVSENIANLRKAKGYTQEELANAVGVSAQAVSKWECGGLPDVTLIPSIAQFLGITSDDIFGISGNVYKANEKSFTRKICEEIYNNSEFSTSNPELYFEGIRDIIYASHQAIFHDGDIIYSLSEREKNLGITEISKKNQETTVTSEFNDDKGISILSMNENLPLAFIMKQPEDPSVLEITDDMKALFTLLGSDEGAKMISNMYSENYDGQWSIKKCAEMLDVSEEFFTQSLPLLSKLRFVKDSGVEIDGEFYTTICIDGHTPSNLTGLIAMAVMITQPQRWYCMYCRNRSRPYLG